MSDSITRRQLEELMMSLSFNIHTNEDIQFLNQLYNNNQADMYIFRLTNTKKYFESIIIPYCKEHWKEIKEVISDENIKNEFILNFGEENAINNENTHQNPLIDNNNLNNRNEEKNLNQEQHNEIINILNNHINQKQHNEVLPLIEQNQKGSSFYSTFFSIVFCIFGGLSYFYFYFND